MRYILIACLLAGCSAGVPTMEKRDSIRTYVYQAASRAGANASTSSCMAAAVDRMSDADVDKSYRILMSGNVPLGSVPELWATISKCAN